MHCPRCFTVVKLNWIQRDKSMRQCKSTKNKKTKKHREREMVMRWLSGIAFCPCVSFHVMLKCNIYYVLIYNKVSFALGYNNMLFQLSCSTASNWPHSLFCEVRKCNFWEIKYSLEISTIFQTVLFQDTKIWYLNMNSNISYSPKTKLSMETVFLHSFLFLTKYREKKCLNYI